MIMKTEAVRILTGVTTINRRVMSEGDVINNMCEPITRVLSSVFYWRSLHAKSTALADMYGRPDIVVTPE